jgi:hypothetical protein
MVNPLTVLVFFFFNNYDILYMGILVCAINLIITWRLMDPDDYSWMDYYRNQSENAS